MLSVSFSMLVLSLSAVVVAVYISHFVSTIQSKVQCQNIGSQFHRGDVNIRLEEELQADLNG